MKQLLILITVLLLVGCKKHTCKVITETVVVETTHYKWEVTIEDATRYSYILCDRVIMQDKYTIDIYIDGVKSTIESAWVITVKQIRR